jgi:hypothetical protein
MVFLTPLNDITTDYTTLVYTARGSAPWFHESPDLYSRLLATFKFYFIFKRVHWPSTPLWDLLKITKKIKRKASGKCRFPIEIM